MTVCALLVASLLVALPAVRGQAQTVAAPPPPPRVPGRAPAPARGAFGTSLKDLKYPPPRLAEIPAGERFQLANGLKVLLMEDRETPSVSAVALVRAGSVLDPPDRAGLAAFTAALIRSGGTGQRTPDRCDYELERIGASIESRPAEVTASVSLWTLRENLADALVLFRDALLEPAFRQDKLDYARAGALNAMTRQNDDPRQLLAREFQALVYGRDSAVGRRPEPAGISRISRADVRAFYLRHYTPGNAVLAISGDFDALQMKQSIENLFGQWKAATPQAETPKLEAIPALGGHVALKREMRESRFAIGLPIGAMNDPDAAAVEVAAAVLGGGQQSRLVRRANEMGAAIHQIEASCARTFAQPGLFVVSGTGDPTAAGEAVKLAVEEVRKLRAGDVTEEELGVAREATLVKLWAAFANRSRLPAFLAHSELFGYPSDFLRQFQQRIATVSRADVLRAAKERLDPEKFTAVAVSPVTVFTKPLDPRGGSAATIDLTIPRLDAERAPVSPAAVERAKEMLRLARQASGGTDKLASIKDFTQSASYTVRDGGTENQTDRWIAPSHLRQDGYSSQAGTLARYTDGTNGWLSNGRASTALTGAAARDGKSEVLRVYLSLLLSDSLPGRTVTALDEQTVEVALGDVSARLVLDPETGLPSKLLYDVQLDRQPVMFVEEDYSDFRDVNGIKLPFAVQVIRNGVKHSDGVISGYKLNQGLKVEVLQRRP